MLRATYLFFPFFSSKRKYSIFYLYSSSLFNLLLSIFNCFLFFLYDIRLRSDERNKSLIFRSKQKASKRFLSLRANLASFIPILILFIIIIYKSKTKQMKGSSNHSVWFVYKTLSLVLIGHIWFFLSWKLLLSFSCRKIKKNYSYSDLKSIKK